MNKVECDFSIEAKCSTLNDIIHEHPNCDGAAMGICSYNDFLVYTQTITKLENGVFLDFGSAVAGPEVYLKALAIARNVAKRRGESLRAHQSFRRSGACMTCFLLNIFLRQSVAVRVSVPN